VTLHPPVVDRGHFGSLSALSLSHSYVPSSGRTCGGAQIQKRMYRGGVCHMGFGWQPRALLLSMGVALVLHHCRPLAALLLCCLGLLTGGHLSPHLLLVCIVGGLHSPPLLGGSASLAIPPTVSHEVQNVSSLAAPPLNCYQDSATDGQITS
jgi:hypothetical protein